ncbi:MAG TPA: choice-of-anchor O protein [Nocardioidaceae bacterium]
MSLHSRNPRKGRKAVAIGSAAAVVATTMFGGMAAYADDGGGGEPGKPVLKSISHDAQDPSVEGYVDENEHAFTSYMKFYVPTQHANGVVEPIDYYDVDGTVVDTRDRAKPLVDVFIKGPVEGVDGVGFAGHGKRDAYAAVSLDDGSTWKKTNLSESASETSSTVVRDDVPLFADTDGVYPGDVTNIFHAVAGNNVLVAWPSRYCSSGQPNYSLDGSEEGQAQRAAIAEYLGIDLSSPSPDDLYLLDMYLVAGKQGSVDYAEDKWEQNWPVGEVPFNCLWTARGELVAGDDPRTETLESSYMRWFNTERLTSGRRDVARIEVAAVAGAGFAITWQEDPEGLRPGQGEGPGEGWSGAIANSQTDVWYSYIDAEDFDVVQDPTDPTGATPMTFDDYTALAATDTTVTQKPKPFVPMAMPMRLTDNAKCNVTNPAPYCYGAASGVEVPTDDEGIPLDPITFGLKDLCQDVVTIPTGHNNTPTDICVTQDGLPLLGNTAATRPRLNLFGYDSTGKVKDAVIDNAFVVVQAEEDKGLGRALYLADPVTGLPTDTQCTEEDDEKACVPFDDGKDQRYYSFSMSLTDKGMVNQKKDGLLANLSFHGNLLNQPEVNWTTGEFFEPKSTADMFAWPDYNYDIYATEIARRGSLLAQDIAKVHPTTSKAKQGLLALPTWKQGQMNQGGPADVMSRRIVMPKNWSVAEGNPYAFRNMQCKTWAYKTGNPHYPEGVCLDSAINLSATVPDTAVKDGDTDTTPLLPTLSEGGTFLASDTNPILQGLVQGAGNTTRVLTWHQCPAAFTTVTSSDGVEVVTCDSDSRTDGDTTLADQSWYNPYDVAKGHRGFLDGDFVMMLYAWSPNWRLNAKGSDRYELYIRRSFTGARDWTTLPSKYTDTTGSTFSGDGTVTCETFRSTETGQGNVDEPRICNEYAAGAPEQARNVTQHKSMRITTLDPRFAMTGGPYGYGITADTLGFGIPNYTSGTGDSEDLRDPSRFFIVYETGDNTTAAEGEPEPLDLFYSRGVNFGDDYEVWAETEEGDVSACYPNDPHTDLDVPEELIGSGFCNEFDQMEQGTPGLEASEASLAANPGGEFLYGTWAELAHEDGELVGSDSMARRVWWIDGFISTTYGWNFGQGSGDGTSATE